MTGTQLGGLPWSTAFATTLVSVSISDLLYRRVANGMSVAILLTGLSRALLVRGAEGLETSVESAFVGLGVLGVLFALGWVGAGDVKVFAGMAAWLTPAQTVWAALHGLVAGGCLSLLLLTTMPSFLTQLRHTFRTGELSQALQRARTQGTTLPFAVALSIGVALNAGGG